MKRRSAHRRIASIVLIGIFALAFPLRADETVQQPPKIYLNGKPGNVTIQDLSGLGTRPLRILVNRNNKTRGNGFIQVYALGVRPGEELVTELAVSSPGVRATVYRIFREKKSSPRYLSMPESVYFAGPNIGEYREKIELFESEYLILVFEKTDSPDEKNIQVRYFEERMRKLVIASYKTNLTLSSLKLKMKDFGSGETEKFFERDAQLLIDRMTNPQRIVLIRLWKIQG